MTYLILACKHRILASEEFQEEGTLPDKEWCRKCGYDERVVGFVR